MNTSEQVQPQASPYVQQPYQPYPQQQQQLYQPQIGKVYPAISSDTHLNVEIQPINPIQPQNYPPNPYGQVGNPYAQQNIQYGQPMVGQPVYPAQIISRPIQVRPYQQDEVDLSLQAVAMSSVCDGVPYPAHIKCPYCHQNVCTVIKHTAGNGTWCCCCLLTLFVWPCFWVPFVVDDCKDKVHICPNCGNIVGVKNFEVV